MTCREFADFIMQYLDGELDEGVRAAFEYHLSGCRNCVAYMEQYRQTVLAGRTAFEDLDASIEEAPEELVQAILTARLH